ncbi:MAG: hypothetical protein R6X18_14520 [Chloroflexota bacterium]|jgi:hypothetical protein
MPERQSILTPFLMLIGIFLLIVWGVGALNTGNWGWFLPFQPEFEPARILVRRAGQSYEYRPGDPGFSELSEALNSSFSDFSNSSLVPLGLSEETLQAYNESATVIEAFYPQPIRFNSPVRMDQINQVLIPIEGRHAGNRYVFLGVDGRWLAGTMVMHDDTQISEVMRTLGHLSN